MYLNKFAANRNRNREIKNREMEEGKKKCT